LKLLPLTACAIGLIISSAAFANDDMYGVATIGFTKTNFAQQGADGATYKLALGYEFDPQWYAEFGYQKLINQSQLDPLPSTETELANADFGLQADALFVSMLGKAGGNLGELFYRLGVMNVDVRGENVTEAQDCSLGQASVLTLANDTDVTLCKYDEGIVAGMLGIGFDFYIGVNLMLRTEIEHIRGEHGFESNAAYVGLRYNF
jgi:hypothetical protein